MEFRNEETAAYVKITLFWWLLPFLLSLSARGLWAADARPVLAIKDCADCPEVVTIPSGSFEMGMAPGQGRYRDESPLHTVTFRKPFAIGKTEVTRKQWRAVMGNDPSQVLNCGDECPVEGVNWEDAREFTRKLSKKTGKIYRLPTEAEWEYACHAGQRQAYCGSETMGEVGWAGENSGKTPHGVGMKRPNHWGLYDMTGNVWEWTHDCWHDNYDGAPSDGGAWSKLLCDKRVLRGGSWTTDTPENLRATMRIKEIQNYRLSDFGLRVVRELP